MDAIFYTFNDDGSADFTIRKGERSHKFSAFPHGNDAIVSYEETINHRSGLVYTSKPQNHLWRDLMQSDEFTEYLEQEGLAGARRERQ
jgi:hypothetical protein